MTAFTTRAAIFRSVDEPQEVAEVDLGPLGPDDVIVEMRAVGICGTDLHVVTGDWVRARPMVLGHEGAGVVVQAGDAVTHVAPGDHVVLCWAAPCRECEACLAGAEQRCLPVRAAIGNGTLVDGTTRIARDGATIYRMTTTGAFAEHVLVPAGAAMPLPAELPLDEAALLGCAALTGVGAALNSADIDGSTDVVVIGAGGVGQFAIQGARIAGAPRIVAVDPSPQRRELALRLGATEALAPGELSEPVDRAIDAVGAPATTGAAMDALRGGGRAVVVGLPVAGARLDLDPFGVVFEEKTLTGSIYGSEDPTTGLGRLLELVRDGQLELAPLLGTRYPLDAIEDAVREARSAAGGRVILEPTYGNTEHG